MSDTNLWMWLVIPILTAVFTKIVNTAFELIVRLLLVNKSLTSDQMVREMDKFLIESNKDTDFSQGTSKKPTDTWHIRKIDWGFIVAIRNSKTEWRDKVDWYTIYGTRKAVDKITAKLEGVTGTNKSKEVSFNGETGRLIDEVKEIKIEVHNFESPCPWKTSFTSSNEFLPSNSPYTGQEKCIDIIVGEYRRKLKNNNRKGHSVLISGQPGIGKTNIALFLAEKINARVVFGYDLTAPGVSLDDTWRLAPSVDSPIILVLDECDSAFKQADQNVSPKEFRCLAQNKTALNSLFDRFERTNYLIVLGTTNVPFGELASTYKSYIRKGRFCQVFTMSLDSCHTENNNFTGSEATSSRSSEAASLSII